MARRPLPATQVTIQTQWRGGEGEGFAAAFTPFVEATGINVVPDIIGTSHETVLRSRVEGGAPPDMAILAQPAAIIQYGQEGSLIDIASFMDTDALAADHAATIGLYQDGDSVWGIPYKVDVKAVIWYPIPAFEAAGLRHPHRPGTSSSPSRTTSSPTAARRSAWASARAPRPAGRRPTSSRPPCCARPARRPTTSGSATSCPSTRAEVKAAMDLAAQIYFTAGLRARRQHRHHGARPDHPDGPDVPGPRRPGRHGG